MNLRHTGNRDVPEFSWSLTRYNLFNSCRRAYYYRYYGAAGGWDVYADERKRFMYLFKHMKKTESWLEEIVKHAVSSAFQKNRSGVGKDILEKHIYSEVSKRFFNGWHQVQAREWQSDPGKLNLFEPYYADDDSAFFASFEKIKIRIGQVVKTFVSSPLFEELAALDFLSWKLNAKPIPFQFQGLKVWAAPDLVWADKGRINILDIKLGTRHKGKPKKELLSPPSVAVLMAAHKLRTDPSKTDYRTVFMESLPGKDAVDSFECASLKPQAVEKAVVESAREMLALIGPDGNVDEAACPMVSEHPATDCLNCEYRMLCTDYLP